MIYMNNKININPSSTKWLEKDDRAIADYFCDLGFRSLKQILNMRVFDLMNMQGLNAVRVEEVITCLYKWLNPNTAIDEAIYNGMMLQPFHYTSWRKVHKDLSAIKVSDLVLTPGINMKAIQHFYDAIRKALLKRTMESKKRNCDLQFLLVLLIRFYCMGSSILSASCFARSSILY